MRDPVRQYAQNVQMYESFSPYYLFFRRAILLTTMIIIAAGLYATGLNQVVVAVLTGLLIGPIIGLERYLVLKAIQKRKQAEG